jgi:hypothetical protein
MKKAKNIKKKAPSTIREIATEAIITHWPAPIGKKKLVEMCAGSTKNLVASLVSILELKNNKL